MQTDFKLYKVDMKYIQEKKENIRYYKKLCAQELEWCQTNNEPFAGRNRCLDLCKLEAEHK